MNADLDQAATLFYSDDPEKIPDGGEGVLFDCDLVPGRSQRLLAYHVNDGSAPCVVAIRFVNITKSAVEMHLVGTFAPPSTAYLHVGHRSTALFLAALAAGAHSTVTVAPGENVIVATVELQPNDLASGIFEFMVASGASARCSVVAAKSADRVVPVAQSGRVFRPDCFGRRGRFDITANTPIPLATTVGSGVKPQARIGTRKFANSEQRADGTVGNALKGEYGIVSTLAVTIKNPTAAATKVALMQSAHGGQSTASYIIGDRLVESGTMDAVATGTPPSYVVHTWNVPATASVSDIVLTMPDNASNSPVVLTLVEDASAVVAELISSSQLAGGLVDARTIS